MRDLHAFPLCKGAEPEIQQPLRFILLFGNKTDNIFVKPFWNELLLEICLEPMPVFGICDILYYSVVIFLHKLCKVNSFHLFL